MIMHTFLLFIDEMLFDMLFSLIHSIESFQWNSIYFLWYEFSEKRTQVCVFFVFINSVDESSTIKKRSFVRHFTWLESKQSTWISRYLYN